MSRITIAIHRVFPHGGLQRDALRTAEECIARGHRVRLVTQTIDGPRPADVDVHLAAVRGTSNHARARRFGAWLGSLEGRDPSDAVIGFDKLPGLDLYFAGDRCYADRVHETRSRLARLTPRYRAFRGLERAVFTPEATTRILLLHARQAEPFRRIYGTPAGRFVTLPPGIARDRARGASAARQRAAIRSEFGVRDEEHLVLLLGSDFERKGLARVLRAAAALPEGLRDSMHVAAVGADDPRPFRALADELGLGSRLTCCAGRDDVPALLQGADILVHPAHTEAGGAVLLEALVAGTPVVATSVCGYAPHVAASGAGRVLAEPFRLDALVSALTELARAPREELADLALRYAAAHPELHAMHSVIVDELERTVREQRP